MHLSTISEDKRVFPQRSCSLTFHSDMKTFEGINLLFFAHRRDFELGTFDIDCTIDGTQVKAEKVRGFHELVWARY